MEIDALPVMKNRWNKQDAEQIAVGDDLAMRVYTSQILGKEADLVLHGGGNTSVKGQLTTIFGETEDVLFVKGSGWDLKTIEAAGFPAVSMDYLLKLGRLQKLSDSEMMRQLRLALMDPNAPTPSVEAILHALIPHKIVDHSHADAVVTISNTANGESLLQEIYGDEVLILPYIMPGFILAQQVAEAACNVDWEKLRGIVLMHHGIFTFHEDAKASYEAMIDLVNKAELYLDQSTNSSTIALGSYNVNKQDTLELSRLRRAAGAAFGGPVLVTFDTSNAATGFAELEGCDELATRGPLTPDHTIHTKAFAAIFENDPAAELKEFITNYKQYFDEYSDTEHSCLDTMPRYGVWRNKGMVYLAANLKRLQIVQDISEHTLKAIQFGEALGGWQPLPRKDLFEVEYWELEQAKLKTGANRGEYEGKVVLITGAASGIGKACVEHFLGQDAVVVALDLSQGFEHQFKTSNVLALNCDVTDPAAVESSLLSAIQRFGGIDVLVSNAGNFSKSQNLKEVQDEDWDKSLELNLSSHMKVLRACLPYLQCGFDPAVIFVASKNVSAPGPGAGAYSAAKAGLTQLARVAALECGADGIRVNTVHPNAVYDTAIWTDEVLAQRAAHYGLTVEEYKTANVLKAEVSSADVASAISLFAGTALSKTTGSQLPVDGGHERVI
jgi:rhamnose utilization protein RhaD (predicted bifunctional aldolase and dehydrogenase)/NAD(P)-dependent dehydrogenase (short-subunit alcohol dehydrogenase family)